VLHANTPPIMDQSYFSLDAPWFGMYSIRVTFQNVKSSEPLMFARTSIGCIRVYVTAPNFPAPNVFELELLLLPVEIE
jgi:hypothetical protein